MKYKIEINHPNLSAYKFFLEEQLIVQDNCKGSVLLNCESSYKRCQIWFEPWGIVPMIRVNNFMIDFALAEIDLFDHKFDIILDDDFFLRYRENDLLFRKKSVFGAGIAHDPYIYDSVIGVGSTHSDIINQIKKVLDIE
jgi:hypothetical protein